MRSLTLLLTGVAILFLMTQSAFSDDPRIGSIKLLPGYKHEKLQGFDSIVGTIAKPKGKGLTILYDIGAIPKGAIRFGGSFTDRAKLAPKNQLRWYKEQTIKGDPVHIAYLKDDSLLVAFPKSIPGKGINFYTEVKTLEEMTDALLMLMTFPKDKAPKKVEAKDAPKK
jgi:hypothetical protein